MAKLCLLLSCFIVLFAAVSSGSEHVFDTAVIRCVVDGEPAYRRRHADEAACKQRRKKGQVTAETIDCMRERNKFYDIDAAQIQACERDVHVNLNASQRDNFRTYIKSIIDLDLTDYWSI